MSYFMLDMWPLWVYLSVHIKIRLKQVTYVVKKKHCLRMIPFLLISKPLKDKNIEKPADYGVRREVLKIAFVF